MRFKNFTEHEVTKTANIRKLKSLHIVYIYGSLSLAPGSLSNDEWKPQWVLILKLWSWGVTHHSLSNLTPTLGDLFNTQIRAYKLSSKTLPLLPTMLRVTSVFLPWPPGPCAIWSLLVQPHHHSPHPMLQPSLVPLLCSVHLQVSPLQKLCTGWSFLPEHFHL